MYRLQRCQVIRPAQRLRTTYREGPNCGFLKGLCIQTAAFRYSSVPTASGTWVASSLIAWLVSTRDIASQLQCDMSVYLIVELIESVQVVNTRYLILLYAISCICKSPTCNCDVDVQKISKDSTAGVVPAWVCYGGVLWV